MGMRWDPVADPVSTVDETIIKLSESTPGQQKELHDHFKKAMRERIEEIPPEALSIVATISKPDEDGNTSLDFAMYGHINPVHLIELAIHIQYKMRKESAKLFALAKGREEPAGGDYDMVDRIAQLMAIKIMAEAELEEKEKE